MSKNGEIRLVGSNIDDTVERIPRLVTGVSFISMRNLNESLSMHHSMPRVLVDSLS